MKKQSISPKILSETSLGCVVLSRLCGRTSSKGQRLWKAFLPPKKPNCPFGRRSRLDDKPLDRRRRIAQHQRHRRLLLVPCRQNPTGENVLFGAYPVLNAQRNRIVGGGVRVILKTHFRVQIVQYRPQFLAFHAFPLFSDHLSACTIHRSLLSDLPKPLLYALLYYDTSQRETVSSADGCAFQTILHEFASRNRRTKRECSVVFYAQKEDSRCKMKWLLLSAPSGRINSCRRHRHNELNGGAIWRKSR